jgi:hypothetical protein
MYTSKVGGGEHWVQWTLLRSPEKIKCWTPLSKIPGSAYVNDYLVFYVPLKIISLTSIWRCHHYRWRAAKFRPMLGAQGLWAGRDLYCATPAVFPVSSEGPSHSVASYDTQGDVENLFEPGSSRVPFQSPLTIHKGMWRTYSNPDKNDWPYKVTRGPGVNGGWGVSYLSTCTDRLTV